MPDPPPRSDMLVELVVAVVGSNALTGLVTYFATRRKTNADAAKVLAEAALELLAPYKELPKEVIRLSVENERLRTTVDELRKELHHERELAAVRQREWERTVATLMSSRIPDET